MEPGHQEGGKSRKQRTKSFQAYKTMEYGTITLRIELLLKKGRGAKFVYF